LCDYTVSIRPTVGYASWMEIWFKSMSLSVLLQFITLTDVCTVTKPINVIETL